MACVHEEQRASSSRPIEIGVRQRFELRRLPRVLSSRPGISIPGQINQVTFRYRTAANAVDVDQPRFARRGAGARQRLANECIDQARFADVRPPDQSHFRQPVAREISRAGSARHELRDYLHISNGSWLWALGPQVAVAGLILGRTSNNACYGPKPGALSPEPILNADACLLWAQ